MLWQFVKGRSNPVSETNPLFTQQVRSSETKTVIDKVASAPATGKMFVGTKETVLLTIYGTATAATVNFKGKAPGGVITALNGYRLADSTLATFGGMNETWRLDIGLLDELQLELTSVTGGAVTVDVKG